MVGNNFIGHASTHLAHLIHGIGSNNFTSSLSNTNKPVVPFIAGTSITDWASPIIGPPINTLPGLPLKPPHCSIRSIKGVPILINRFFGSITPDPVTVVILSMSGIPVFSTLATAAQVPALFTMTPASIGSPPEGTSRPVTAFMSCFSPPCGYLVAKTTTSIPAFPFNALFTASTASSLLSSMPIKACLMPVAFIMASRPSTTSSGCSNKSLWSAVIYGSHSAPFTIIVSTFFSGGKDSFT